MKPILALLTFAALGAANVHQESPMDKAAKTFLATLSDAQRMQAMYALNSDQRSAWLYVPGDRKGVSWGEMDEKQKAAGIALLKASLSKDGYETIQGIRNLEPVLREMENGNMGRDPQRYWFVFFGSPNSETPWVWRYEGHHCSLTFSCNGDVQIGSTPQFLGSNPAEVRSGSQKGTRVLARVQDLGFALVESLSSDQQKKAMVSDKAPADIVTSNSRKAVIEGHLGLSYSEMDKKQKAMLRALIKTYADVQLKTEEDRRLKAVEKDGYDSVVFAWLGPMMRNTRHYYRIQGKSFLIEFDTPQDDGNHIHSVWRDFKGDFGEDVLAEHYKQIHH